MVRIGGGYQPLLDYLRHEAKGQSIKLQVLMDENQHSLADVIQ